MEPLPWYSVVVPAVAAVGFVLVGWLSSSARLRFAAVGMVVMVGYGVLMDQVSARLCPEYFTVFHPPIPGLTDPTLLGIAWGFLGAWWGGYVLGYAAGVAATVGPRPPLPLRELARPLGVLLAAVAGAAAVTGFNVARHADLFGVTLDPSVGAMLPPERHRAALVVACYHFAAYVTAAAGSVVLCVWIGRTRKSRHLRPAEMPPCPNPSPSSSGSNEPR